MTEKKREGTVRTKAGTLNKKTVAEAIKEVSATRRNTPVIKETTSICRDAKTGHFIPSTGDTYRERHVKGSDSSGIRTKSGTLKRAIVKSAVVSVSRTRSKEKK